MRSRNRRQRVRDSKDCKAHGRKVLAVQQLCRVDCEISHANTDATSTSVRTHARIKMSEGDDFCVMPKRDSFTDADTGGPLNVINSKYGTSNPRRTVPVMRLITEHHPKSFAELRDLISSHVENKVTQPDELKWFLNRLEKVRMWNRQQGERGRFRQATLRCTGLRSLNNLNEVVTIHK